MFAHGTIKLAAEGGVSLSLTVHPTPRVPLTAQKSRKIIWKLEKWLHQQPEGEKTHENGGFFVLFAVLKVIAL